MTMTKSQVMTLLKQNKDARGIDHWNRKPRELKSFGIGLTRLRKIAKEIGRDHQLSQQLWKTDVYDARVIGLLIDEPRKMTREQVEAQVEESHEGLFVHVFATCGATLAKAPFASALVEDWRISDDPICRRCAYGLLYELSKRNIAGMDDAYFLSVIADIQESIHNEDMWVAEMMKGALIGIGKRNKKINTAAIKAVKAIGPVDVDYGDDNACEPVDVLKHLTSDYLKKKFAAAGR